MRLARARPVRLAAALAALLIGTSDRSRAQEPTLAQIREQYAAATAAYDKKDYPTYLGALEDLARIRPNHPRILTKLAGAYALNDRAADAAAALDRLAALTLFVDVQTDPDFARVRDNPALRSGIAAMDAIRTRRIGAPEAAWTIHDKTFVPEGVTYDPVSNTFYASSQYQRKIVAIDAAGRVKDFVGEGQDGLWMVSGIGIDVSRRWLWAVSTADEAMRGFSPADAGHAGVFAFDIRTSKLVRKITVDGANPTHYFDDLTVGPDGRVFLSDGGTGSIYTIAPDGRELDVFVPPGTLQGPNGLALSREPARLYVSDYAGYIFAIDLATRVATKLPQPSGVALYGIDGLAWHAGELIGVQNGVEPPRVVRLQLSGDGLSIARASIAVMNDAHMREPTLGVVVGDAYYFVADSGGTALRNAKGRVGEAALAEPTILKIGL